MVKSALESSERRKEKGKAKCAGQNITTKLLQIPPRILKALLVANTSIRVFFSVQSHCLVPASEHLLASQHRCRLKVRAYQAAAMRATV